MQDKLVKVRKLKYDGSVKSEWEGDLLARQSDEWLVVLHHPRRHRKLADGKVESYEQLFAHCCNVVQPLTVLMAYDGQGRFREAKCDAALPARHQGYVIEFVDLDLDVIVEPVSRADGHGQAPVSRADGHRQPVLSHYVRDYDDFAQRRESMRYSEHAVQQAHAGIALAQALVTSRRFPFDERLVPVFDAAAFA